MAIKTVLRMGHPLLSQTSQIVDDPHADVIKTLIQDMFDTMRHYEGAGLAAPQIGVLLRVVIFGFSHNSRYPQAGAIPETVLINPEIEILSPLNSPDWEGCLSIPGMRGRVNRADKIRYRGMDSTGEIIDKSVSGFHARVVQHECDHLDGILYPQRIQDLNDFGFIEELEQHGRYQRVACDSE